MIQCIYLLQQKCVEAILLKLLFLSHRTAAVSTARTQKRHVSLIHLWKLGEDPPHPPTPPHTHTLSFITQVWPCSPLSCPIRIGDVWFSKCLPSVILLLPFVKWVSIVPFHNNKALEMRAEERGSALRASIWHVNRTNTLRYAFQKWS